MVGLGIILILSMFANLLITAGAAQALLDQHEEFFKKYVMEELEKINDTLERMI